MKTVEETRRELFETHWSNSYGYSRAEAVEFGVFAVNDRGVYLSTKLNDSWHTWNAALDSVVIELPDCFDTYGYSAEVARVATDCCADAIEQTGLGLKVLP